MKGIVWLASYPKSGNTWFRIFLINLLSGADVPVDINSLGDIPIASSRPMFDTHIGLESSDLKADEIDRLRPELYDHLAEIGPEPFFIKIHDAYTYVAKDLPLIPSTATRAAIYIIRNPLDVVVSFANHSGWDLDTAVAKINDPDFTFNRSRHKLFEQLRQKLLSWSGHVLSWVDGAAFPVCVLRYEDMQMQPLETFERAVRFAGLEHSRGQIEKALGFSSFQQLRKQEETAGFLERTSFAKQFFRKGKIGSWREDLSGVQAQKIVKCHEEVMRRFGYLDETGNIVF